MRPLKSTGFVILQRYKKNISTVQIESDCPIPLVKLSVKTDSC